MKIETSKWNEKLNEALIQDSVTGIVESLQSQATAHAGTAKSQVKRRAIKTIQRHYKSEPNALLRVALELSRSGNPTTEEVSAHLLVSCYEVNPIAVEKTLHDLADSSNWEVREWVADACEDEQVRWNVAMVFSAADEAKYAVAAKDVLETLSMDKRSPVQRAVVKAMKNIRNRCPEFFEE